VAPGEDRKENGSHGQEQQDGDSERDLTGVAGTTTWTVARRVVVFPAASSAVAVTVYVSAFGLRVTQSIAQTKRVNAGIGH
jgi:hypothetical protein